MTWSATASGTFHEVVQQIKDLQITGDQKALQCGHVEIGKKMALAALDERQESGNRFSVSLYGHTTDRLNYNTGANVSVLGEPDEPNQP